MLNSNALPNFIVIGAGRSGTTSLYYYFKQHPDILMSSIKETNFFAYDPERMDQFVNINETSFPVKDLSAYQKLFLKRKKTTAIGEISPMYLWHPSVPRNIFDYLPNVKLIAILRNPVGRAYSAYWHYVSINMEKRSFAQALAEEADHAGNKQWPLGRGTYVSLGFYYQQIVRYLDYFSREQIKIYFFDDFQNDPLEIMRDVYTFIGVRIDFVPNIILRYNSSGLPKNKLIHFMLRPRHVTKRLRSRMPKIIHDPIFNFLMKIKDQNLMIPPLDKVFRKQLIDIYHDDILQLGNLLNLDLSHWLEL